MTRADKLIEGFKLGSLGAKRKFKEPIEKETAYKEANIQDFKRTGQTEWEWTEELLEEWVNPFRTIKDWIGHPIKVQFHIRKVSEKKYSPALDVFLQVDNRPVNIGSFNYKRFHFLPGEGESWMIEISAHRARPRGLKGLGFPDLWEEDK